MLGHDFYHSLTRNYIIMFGNIFNDITVRRFDRDGKIAQNIPVPVRYGPKSKYVVDALTPPEGERVSLKLPMMSFYDANIVHDPERQTNPVHIVADNDPQLERSLNKMFVPVPYRMTMELSIITKNVEDGAMIIEQILPFFTPSLTSTANIIKGLKPFDITIALTSVSKEHAYEEMRQVVVWTLNFDMAIWLFGAKTNQGLIKKSIVSLIAEETNKTMTRVTTTPGLTADGKPTSNSDESIDYRLIKPEDDYGYIENIEDFFLETN
ncbi:tail terminator [Ochrobactrum phage vB_OspM_OC]|nr:tail terminator [Ochrobactrum phage vB_OspM_OC]